MAWLTKRSASARLAQREAGLTLTELMVVIVIVAVLVVATGYALTRQDNSSAATMWAYRVLVACRQARALAVDTNSVTQVDFASDGTSLKVDRASLAGPGPPTGSVWLSVTSEAASNAVVQATTTSADTGVVASPGTTLTRDAIQFYPDGSADATTVYIRDASAVYQHKVVVFGLTGYTQHLTRW